MKLGSHIKFILFSLSFIFLSCSKTPNDHGLNKPQFVVYESVVSFEDTNIDQVSERGLMFGNVGAGDLIITDIELFRNSSNVFSVSNISQPFMVPAKTDSLRLAIKFVPTAIDTFSAVLTIRSSDGDNQQATVILKGSGTKKNDVNYSQHIQPIILKKCAITGCHSASAPAASLDLTGSEPLNFIGDNGPAIVPALPHYSNLYLVLIKDLQPVSRKMPPESNPLPEIQIRAIETWIQEGAIP